MPHATALIVALTVFSAALVALLVVRPSITATRGGKILAFAVLFLLPLLSAAMGVSDEMDHSKTTSFCLSCHTMESYGKSLYIDDPNHLPAAHFQNHRIPAEEACYTCHTDYAMYGSLRVKLNGLHHVYVQYFRTPMNPIHLYHPYNNRECLHCHEGARSFQSPTHMAMMDDLKNNTLSCVASGCHDTVHKVDTLDKVKLWSPGQ